MEADIDVLYRQQLEQHEKDRAAWLEEHNAEKELMAEMKATIVELRELVRRLTEKLNG